MKIQKHNARKADLTTLISAGTVQVISSDDYVVIVECHGLDPKGDDQSFRVTITRNEIALILRSSAA